MSENKIVRFIFENKQVPLWINAALHVVAVVIFYSFLMMCLAVFFLQPEWSAIDIRNNIPFIGIIAPYSFYISPTGASYFWGVLAVLYIWGTWLFGTRVKNTNKSLPRRTISFIIFWLTFCSIIIFYCIRLINVIGYHKVVSLHYTIEEQYQEMMNVGSLELIGYLLMLIPVFVMGSFSAFLYGQYRDHDSIKEWFRSYKFQRGWMGRFGEEGVNKLPDIQLARDAETNAPVVLQGESRQLGTLLIGPPGSGKTAIKIKTSFRTDLGHIQRMINAYPKYVKQFGNGTDAFQRKIAEHLIGSVIIEPAKDLCDDAYELALEHNIPDDFIVYLDPSNPNTPGFNLMVGPTAEVVETITSVLESVAETKDEFFKQAARAVLKHYVYLLKFSKGDSCTILELDDLYQDPRKAMDLLEQLEKTVPSEETIELMDQDGRIHWIIVKKIIRWFRNEGLSISTNREGMVEKYPAGHEHAGKPKVTDLQYEFTRQTRNLLSDITKNPYLARILYAENKVNLDKLFSKGGILLVNTDLGNLQALSSIFGKLVLLCVQNAVFRRKGTEKTRPMVSFYADEFYDYMNEKFLQLTSQGRKFRFAPLVACQSLSQFGVKFGKDYTESMLGTIRNTIVYGGTSVYDTELLSKYLGTETVEELQISERYSPTYMESPSYAIGETVTQKEKEIASSDNIMFQEFRYSYIRMVDEKSSKKAIRAVGDFVDTSDSKKWKKGLDEKALKFFMEHWMNDIESYQEEKNESSSSVENLREELSDLTKDQSLIREEKESISGADEEKAVSSNRLKPFTGTKESSFRLNENTIVVPPQDASEVSIKPLPLENVKPQRNEEILTPPPVVESPFQPLPLEEEKLEAQQTISFSAAFGSKEKNKISELLPLQIKKVNKQASFTQTFRTPEKEAGNVDEVKELEEVTLDESALNFLKELRKN